MKIQELQSKISFYSRTKKTTRFRRLAVCTGVVILLPIAAWAMLQLRYDREYPAMEYSTRTVEDPIARLQRRIEAGGLELRFDETNGYLPALLEELHIDVASQMLVFTKSSFQTPSISPETPRALYFTDDAYIGFVQGGNVFEISAVDPQLGAIFYTLDREETSRPVFERQDFLCLRCHDSYSLSGGGVPRYLMGSSFADETGELVSHEYWFLTNDQSPIRERWGGWYVTGTHGEQQHMGNLIIRDITDAAEFDRTRGANVTDLSTLIDTEPYLGKHSDIVALLVMGHQIHVQNLITRVNYDTRTALYDAGLLEEEASLDADTVPGEILETIQNATEPLVEALLLAREAPPRDPIAGTSGFSDVFSGQGPSDRQGRSLRHLDLNERLFRYPCSYMIYSESFDALPKLTKDYVYRRLRDVLSGKDQSESFAHLSSADRQAILEILEATKAGFATSETG